MFDINQFASRTARGPFDDTEDVAAASRLVATLALAGLLGLVAALTRHWYAAGVLYLAPIVHAVIHRRSTAARAAIAAAVASVREQCQSARGFKASLQIVLGALTSASHARGASVIVSNVESGRAVRWDFTAADGQLLSTEDARSHGSWLSATASAGEWTAIVEIIEPEGRRSSRAVRVLDRVVRELTPDVYGAYARSCIRARASKEERAHLARELHDGPIQSLIGAEMSLEALRLRQVDSGGVTAALAQSLGETQRLLRQEIVNLRELMVRMRPLDLPAGGLPGYLDRAVRRFSEQSGIRAEFVAEDRSAALLPRHHAVALARIAQEALANVRKHSAATRVIITLQKDVDATHLVIHDNGRGFDPQRHTTPEAIAESVRDLGGGLTIESSPGRGARLEITVPGRRLPAMQKVAS
jgi:signal transduction histidine kinase